MTRQEEILKYIVEDFIKTAEPVGSKALLEAHHLPYSSATIRAEMNALEKAGLLEKTHTSSGRVPSGKGYNYYVENLREGSINEEVKYAIQKVLDAKTKSVEEVIKESCEILSHMTNLASVVLGSKVDEESLMSIQIIPLNEKTATAVFVTDQGYVENKTFFLNEKMDVNELQKTVTLLNDRLKGTPISDIVSKMEAMKPALTDYIVGHDVMYQAIMETFIRFAGERIKLYGKENLIDTPEFAEDTEKLKKVLKLIDNPVALREAMSDIASKEGAVKAKIGDGENGLEDMTILTAEVNVPGGHSTSISLLGPTRMDYERAMGLLETVSKTLDEYFNPEASEEKKGEDSTCQKKSKNSSTKK